MTFCAYLTLEMIVTLTPSALYIFFITSYIRYSFDNQMDSKIWSMKVTIKHIVLWIVTHTSIWTSKMSFVYVGSSYLAICIIGFCVFFDSIYKYNSINVRHKYETHLLKGGNVEVICLCMSNSFITSIFWFYDFLLAFIILIRLWMTDWGIKFSIY